MLISVLDSTLVSFFTSYSLNHSGPLSPRRSGKNQYVLTYYSLLYVFVISLLDSLILLLLYNDLIFFKKPFSCEILQVTCEEL
jgi:hypothetical protein